MNSKATPGLSGLKQGSYKEHKVSWMILCFLSCNKKLLQELTNMSGTHYLENKMLDRSVDAVFSFDLTLTNPYSQ